MPTYAQNTTVPIDRSKAEIERTLQRYGASTFMYGWSGDRAVIGFDINGRRYKIELPLPAQGDFAVTEARRVRRSRDAQMSAWEQACRQRWRALALWVKAVLEASEAGIITIESALLSFTLLPNGQTVGEWSAPQLLEIYETGHMPPLLPG